MGDSGGNQVFSVDDHIRSYRMKPKRGKVWFQKTKGKALDSSLLKSQKVLENQILLIAPQIAINDEGIESRANQTIEKSIISPSPLLLIKRSETPSLSLNSRNGIESDSSGRIDGYSARDQESRLACSILSKNQVMQRKFLADILL